MLSLDQSIDSACILHVYWYLTTSTHIQNNSRTDVALRDVSKALDKVWHNDLKYKVLQIDPRTCFTHILCYFLHNTKASIRIDNFIGPSFPLLSGVPQGAAVSPTFYGFYIHDIPAPNPHSSGVTRSENKGGSDDGLLYIYIYILVRTPYDESLYIQRCFFHCVIFLEQ